MKKKVVSIDAGRRALVFTRRDALVAEHLELVEIIARGVARSLPPSFDIEDFIGEGGLALLQAADAYHPSAHGGTPFSAFARQRIRGAMLDSVRRRHYAENTRPSIEDVPEVIVFDPIERSIDARRLRREVSRAISWLSNEERGVLELYYGPEELSLAAIGERAELSIGTVWAIHKRAIELLRKRLKVA